MAHDYDALLWEQMGNLADLAADLEPADWDHPSLCEGWRVRDVYGHMCVGHTYPLPKLLAKVAANGFDVDKGSAKESAAWADAHTPEEIAATIDHIATDHLPLSYGVSRRRSRAACSRSSPTWPTVSQPLTHPRLVEFHTWASTRTMPSRSASGNSAMGAASTRMMVVVISR